MSYAVACALGALVGVLTGWLTERLPVPSLLQTTIAGVVSLAVASLAAGILWMLLPPPAVTIMAISFGLTESGAVLLVSVAASIALDYGLAWVAPLLNWPSLAMHRAMVVALVGGLYGALSFAAGSAVRPMGR